jgi:putative transposase
MPYRTLPLVNQSIYHVFTKSIAGFKVFNFESDYVRMLAVASYYLSDKVPCRFSFFNDALNRGVQIQYDTTDVLVRVIAYCIMPTHVHFILQQTQDYGISRYMNLILKSYSKYLNIKLDRKGPLWQGRFETVLISTDEQLLHLTRYIHLNPVTAYLVERPQDWLYSSYQEYISQKTKVDGFCTYDHVLTISKVSYEEFVIDRISYQRELASIKSLLLE